MLETVGQFRQQYDEQAQVTLGSMMATPSLLSRVIESQVQDAELVSIRARIQSSTAGEGWAIHTDGSLRYRGRVMVPQSMDLRRSLGSSIAPDSLCIQVARRCIMTFVANITRAG